MNNLTGQGVESIDGGTGFSFVATPPDDPFYAQITAVTIIGVIPYYSWEKVIPVTPDADSATPGAIWAFPDPPIPTGNSTLNPAFEYENNVNVTIGSIVKLELGAVDDVYGQDYRFGVGGVCLDSTLPGYNANNEQVKGHSAAGTSPAGCEWIDVVDCSTDTPGWTGAISG